MNPDYENALMRGGYLNNPPSSLEDLPQNYTLDSGAGLYHPDEKIEEKLKQLEQKNFQVLPIKSYLFAFLKNRLKNIKSTWLVKNETNKFNEKFLKPEDNNYSVSKINERYGEEKYSMLSSLINISK